MASSDPSGDSRAQYDYVQSDGAPSGDLQAVASVVEDIRFDEYSRQLYATDASIYERKPIAVAFPRTTSEVSDLLTACAENEIPVLPRGGGTSLAGQAVNEAVVLDFTKHMNGIEVDPEAQHARVQAGVILESLNAALEPYDQKFAPDPAWGDKSTIGGAIGNNTTGAHSLVYGKTDAYLKEAEVVLADGAVTTLGSVDIEDVRARANSEAEDLLPRIYAAVSDIVDEEASAVLERYPEMKRNVSGYNLDRLVKEAESGTINFARLLAGSEGTLAVVTEAVVVTVSVPETKSIALLAYESLDDAMHDVAPILEHDPAAVEVMDDVLLDLARETTEFEAVVDQLPVGTNSLLLVEFYAESDDSAREKIDTLLADRLDSTTPVSGTEPAADASGSPTFARDVLLAHEAAKRAKFWKLRKSGLPILLSRTDDSKHVAFIEDTAIPPENLPAFVAEFEAILDEHDTFASYYAHAGPGVLHIRPLIDTKTLDGTEQMASIADSVTDLVVRFGGSVSGEHGDGRARTKWNRKLYGEDLWETFRALKSAFDPDWILNPGNICGDHDMTEDLRFGADYEFDADFEPELQWETKNGFQGMVELCHGCGGCRGQQSTTGGVMCPTYRAAQEEIQATRGRANMLRAAMSGKLDEEELFTDEFVDEVLDLCIGCKGCSKDCPSEVDLAKLKAEVTHEVHQRNGASLRDHVFANIDRLSVLGSAFSPLSNWLPKLPGAAVLLEKTLGIARERSLPEFHRTSLEDWFNARGGPAVSVDSARRRVILFPDTYTNYNHPSVGKAAVGVLEAAGVHVQIASETVGSGRPPFSKGFLDLARRKARTNVEALAPRTEDGWDIVVPEPSDAVMLQSDYLDLLSGDDVRSVAERTYGVMEYLNQFQLDAHLQAESTDKSVAYHGHCHQKSTGKDHHAVGVLRRVGYAVDPLDSTCCGMAGSFGYEAEHYSMSQAIASLLLDRIDGSDADDVVAPGTSCRGQLAESTGEEPLTPIEMVHRLIIADEQ